MLVEGEEVQPNFTAMQNTNILDDSVTRTRDPVAQVATGCLPSDGTHTHDIRMDTGALPDNLTGGGNLKMTPNPGLRDTGSMPQPANDPVTLDQAHSAPMLWTHTMTVTRLVP